jgi:hypothetical protein
MEDPLAGYACFDDWTEEGSASIPPHLHASVAGLLSRWEAMEGSPLWLADDARRRAWLDLEVPLPFPLSWTDEP